MEQIEVEVGFNNLYTSYLSFTWALERWINIRIKNGKGIEKWRERINLIFSQVFGWKIEKLRDKKLFY